MKRKMLSILLAIGTIAGLVGPTQAWAAEVPDEEITLTICMHYYDDSKILADDTAEKIKEKYPNVNIEFEELPQDGGQTLKTRAATGDLPDIIKVTGTLVDALSKSGSILPLDNYFEETNYAEENLPQNVIDSCLTSSDGHIYQFPTDGIHPVLWYYNKQIFEDNNIKVPENYDELLTAVEELRSKDIIPLAMFAKEPWPTGAFFDSFALKENPKGIVALEDGSAKASDEGYTKATEKIVKLIDAGIFQDGSTNADFETASALFTEGKAAMFINGSWYMNDVINSLGDNGDFMAFYPTADPGKETINQYCMAGGPDTSGVAVSSNTKYPELAMEIAAMFASEREKEEYSKFHLLTAPVKVDELEIEGELAPLQEKLLSLIPDYTYGSQFIHALTNTKFSTDITEELQKLFAGESAEDFIKNIDKS